MANLAEGNIFVKNLINKSDIVEMNEIGEYQINQINKYISQQSENNNYVRYTPDVQTKLCHFY